MGGRLCLFARSSPNHPVPVDGGGEEYSGNNKKEESSHIYLTVSISLIFFSASFGWVLIPQFVLVNTKRS